MGRRGRPPSWTSEEFAILDDVFPREGVNGAVDALPDRTWTAINVMASKRGLRSPIVADAPKPKLQGDVLEEAIRLRESEGWSFARIGATFGVCEASACSSVLIALCARKGHRPAERDAAGHLLPEGRERLRLAFRKGMKGVDIQLRLGLSASTVSRERRRYEADLKARGKAPLPPPGGGEAYSGAKVPKAVKARIEALLMQGLGAPKVAELAGSSKTTVLRVRTRLIERLRKKGERLPGCDTDGTRRVQASSARFVTDEQKALVRQLLLAAMPVQSAALLAAIGACTAYRIRDSLAAELAGRGETLPRPLRLGRKRAAQLEPGWPPESPAELYRFRATLKDMPFAAAKAAWIEAVRVRADEDEARAAEERAARRADAQRPKTFEEQLEAVRSGKLKLVPAFSRAHLEPRVLEERRATA